MLLLSLSLLLVLRLGPLHCHRLRLWLRLLPRFRLWPLRGLRSGKAQVAFLQTLKRKEILKKFYRVPPTDAVEVI